MTLLPIVDRELRVAARRALTYWLRSAAAAGALALGSVVFLAGQGAGPMQMGLQLLVVLGSLTFVYSLFWGVLMTADCLAEEKREGTLGLLFLTDLKPYDLVLGKLAANSLHTVFGLAAIFPVLGVPLAMGGVTGAEFARLLLVFGCTLFMSLNLGLVVSAYSRDSRQALTRGILWMALLAGLFPALDQIAGAFFRSSWHDFLFWPSPACAFFYGFDRQHATANGALNFQVSIALTLLFGVVFLVWANLALPRAWREADEKTSGPTRWLRHIRPRTGLIAFMRGRVFGDNPVYWLAMGDEAGRRQVNRAVRWLRRIWFLFLVTAVFSPLHEQMFIASFFTAFGLHVLVKVLYTTEACQQIFKDRQSGALELLLVTPISVEEIIAGHRLALKDQFRSAFIKLCVINLLMVWIVVVLSGLWDMSENVQVLFLEAFAGGALMLWLDMRALAWVGMWRGLNSRRTHRAVLATLGQVMLLPWLLIIFVVVTGSFVKTPEEAAITLAVWLLAGVVVDMFVGGIARKRLLNELRATVAQRYQAAR